MVPHTPYTPAPFVHRYPPQQVIFGEGTADALAEPLAAAGITRALLLCGANVGGNRPLLDRLVAGSGGRIAHVRPCVRPHAPMSTVEEAAAAFAEHGCDGMISLGGGSAHDTMRAVALVRLTGTAIRAQFPAEGKAFVQVPPQHAGTPVPMIAIPTTFSAAETTFGGGVTEGGRKFVFVGDDLYIGRLILDPVLFATTPRDVLIATGLNALNHALERICSPRHEPIGDAAFLHSLRLLMPALPHLAGEASPPEWALPNAILGAHLSESTQVLGGIGHAVAHVLGGRFHLPHGIAHGMGILPGLRLGGGRNPSAVAAIAQVYRDLALLPAGEGSLDAVIAATRQFVQRLGVPNRLRDMGLAESDVAIIAADIMQDFSMASAAQGGIDEPAVAALVAEIW